MHYRQNVVIDSDDHHHGYCDDDYDCNTYITRVFMSLFFLYFLVHNYIFIPLSIFYIANVHVCRTICLGVVYIARFFSFSNPNGEFRDWGGAGSERWIDDRCHLNVLVLQFRMAQDFFIYKYPMHEWFPDVFWTTNRSWEPGAHRPIQDSDFREWKGPAVTWTFMMFHDIPLFPRCSMMFHVPWGAATFRVKPTINNA